MIKPGEIFGRKLQEMLRVAGKDFTPEAAEITVRHLGDFYYVVQFANRRLDYATTQKELDYQIAGIGSYGDVLCLHTKKILSKLFDPIEQR